ncbi:MAG TPA: ankyrin repeat domain-containing protein [Terriglobales bacterium]|nr:ankyrin repeat domain-containing protein [Terriglobales bacterium]
MTDFPEAVQSLPDRPDLRHLKDQAKNLLKAGAAESLTEAQFQIARLYGFASWPKLKAHVESTEEIGQLKQAIDSNDLGRVKTLMTRNPALHHAPLGYAQNGPLTWVAECRVPWGPPSSIRLAMAEWMVDHGSDVHQGGDGPLMRAALGDRIQMMELLISRGADVNALWNGDYPILFGACETMNPPSLNSLLEYGADPNCRRLGKGTALDFLIGSYLRSSDLAGCIQLLLNAGGVTKYDVPCLLDLLLGRLERVAQQLGAVPTLVEQRFPELDCGETAGRRLLLKGATLLHVAAEFGDAEAATLLLDRGADVNAGATVDSAGVGGQTPIFHAASQNGDWGFRVAQVLLERGADLAVRAKIPGHYERPDEVVECTPLGYALRFPGSETKTVALLRQRNAEE